MARKAAGERLNRYEAKLDPERVKQDLIKLKPGMLGKQTITDRTWRASRPGPGRY